MLILVLSNKKMDLHTTLKYRKSRTMKIKVLLVEDEILVAEDMAGDLNKEGFEVVDIVISGDEALVSIEKNPPHIILMDINIKGRLDGIETAHLINESYKIPIIYITANTSDHFVTRALKTAPHAFLSKPFNQKDLNIAIDLAIQRHNNQLLNSAKEYAVDLGAVFLKNGSAYVKVKMNDILFIHASGSYSTVFTKHKKYTLSMNLHNFQKKLKDDMLKRIHRSYVVNLKKVDRIEGNKLIIENHEVSVSNAYRDEEICYFNRI